MVERVGDLGSLTERRLRCLELDATRDDVSGLETKCEVVVVVVMVVLVLAAVRNRETRFLEEGIGVGGLLVLLLLLLVCHETFVSCHCVCVPLSFVMDAWYSFYIYFIMTRAYLFY